MSIESDIKQLKSFNSPYQKIIVNLIFTSNWIKTENNNFLNRFDLTSQQYNVLRILRGQYPNPVTVNSIIERMLDKMSNASRLVDKLLLKGYASRSENKDDRRACDVIITEAGLSILDEIDKEQILFEESLKRLTPEEAEQLSILLDKMRGSN